jgi:predicted porin
MKIKMNHVALASLALICMVESSQAMQVAGENLEIYGTLYPEYNVTNYTDGSATGTASNSMQSKKVTPGTLTQQLAPIQKTQLNWSQSYIGFKGVKPFGDYNIGFDFQGVMGKNVDSSISSGGQQNLFTDTRDAFVLVAKKGIGTFQFGQMDTIYKEWGDIARMLGVSSSNFVSTSGVLSKVGWKTAGGDTSFNTRIGNQTRWISDDFNGFQAGISYRADPNRTTTQNQSLSAAAIRWTQGKYYASIQQETHNDYRTFSGTGATESATTLLSANPGSKDVGKRFTLGYNEQKYHIGFDVSQLQFSESATTAGKFTNFTTNTWQMSADYNITPQIVLAANRAVGADGSCSVLGGGKCTTTGIGGTLTSLGAKYDFDKNIGLFALYAQNRNGSNAIIASSAVGGNVTNLALGVLVKF